MTYKNPEHRASLIELLNQCESDLRELGDQPELQQQRTLTFLEDKEEELLLELFELSAQPDYSYTHHFLSLLWSYKGLAKDLIPSGKGQQSLDTILHISQEIVDNWPALTPKKVSRFGILIKSAASIAKTGQ
ncbi:hypothetical protein [Endozoicomonas sp. Mp262]|uniref:hypothetical protein n=1 Tax=Endozoicomonas sp. Mp262 TaxID=2919499 RepID=UPI0021D8056A